MSLPETEGMYRRTTEIVLPWDEFCVMFLKGHKQGEHVALVGQTGSGKSTCGLELCKIVGSRVNATNKRPASVVVLGTKPRDDTLTELGWPIVKKWPPAYGEEHCVVWPRGGPPEQETIRQRAVFRPLLNAIYQEGGQTVCIDEASYFEETPPDGLGLSGTVSKFWGAARGNKLTLIAGTQRPRHVSRSMWSEPSWVIIFPPDDEDDLKRVAQLSGFKLDVLRVVPKLGGFEFLCVRRQRDGVRGLYVSRVEKGRK